MIYLELFLSFFQMGLFGFGGGYAVLPLIKEQVVIQHPWLTMSEFTDLITISQMTPGPIVVNSATFIVATAGSILPSCIIVTMIAKLYLKYRSLNLFQSVLMTLRPCIVAMIASAGISILITAFWGNDAVITLAGTKWSLIVIFGLCVFLLQKKHMNPVQVMLLAGILKVLVSFIGG